MSENVNKDGSIRYLEATNSQGDGEIPEEPVLFNFWRCLGVAGLSLG